MIMTRIASIFALLAITALPCFGAEISGINFADQVTVAGKSLSLNGMGLRQATIFHVNVYAGGLYLESLSHDGDKIAASPEIKHLELIFMRDVGAKDIAKAWAEGFEKNCADAPESAKAGVAELQAATTDMKKGDKMVFNFMPDRVEFTIRDAKTRVIQNKELAQRLVSLWIGKNPPNAGLKTGLLGIKE